MADVVRRRTKAATGRRAARRLRMLREAHAVPLADVLPDWPDPQQRDRAIDSLIADGLAEAADGMLRLPA